MELMPNMNEIFSSPMEWEKTKRETRVPQQFACKVKCLLVFVLVLLGRYNCLHFIYVELWNIPKTCAIHSLSKMNGHGKERFAIIFLFLILSWIAIRLNGSIIYICAFVHIIVAFGGGNHNRQPAAETESSKTAAPCAAMINSERIEDDASS